MRHFLSIIALSLSAVFWSASALAADTPSQVMKKSDQGLTYLSGGIGDEERDEILGREKDFNLKLVFAEKGGSYMADVNVVVLDTKGQVVLEASSTGPIFLTTLPTGHYRVKVSANGKTQQASLTITAKKRLARTFLW